MHKTLNFVITSSNEMTGGFYMFGSFKPLKNIKNTGKLVDKKTIRTSDGTKITIYSVQTKENKSS